MGLISAEQRAQFLEDGYTLIPGFYDVEADILPIQRDIHRIIGLVARRHGLDIAQEPFSPETFDSGYQALIVADRAHGGEIYDLAKQIPAFLRLISHPKADALFAEIRGTDHTGIGADSYGIRIDNPGEEKFRSHWHQEFTFQPQSMDGIVFWTPLMSILDSLGPVNVLPGSHKDGLAVCQIGTTYADKQGAYQIGIHNEDAVVARYDRVAPLTNPGDLILMDFLTIHASGYNTSGRSRWSIQNRFFNYNDETGMKIGWKASITKGTKVQDIFPDHFVEA